MTRTGTEAAHRSGSSARRIVVAGVTDKPLDGSVLLTELSSRADGALVLFEGRVRDHNVGRQVVGLHYDAYAEMADEELTRIAREALERFDASAVGVKHRTGSLTPGEVSLVVAVLAPHRSEAFDAARYVIEELKRRVPIWKKEVYRDGTSAWLGAVAGGPPVDSGEQGS